MTISNRHKKYKRSGSILAAVMVAAIVWIMIAQSMFITFSGQFKMISSSRTALQAQQYAEIALDKLKNINYDELDASGAHGRKKIEGISSDDWQDEVTIGAESTITGSDDAKQRIATVNVYKVGDTLPRYTVEIPLSSQGNNNTIDGSLDQNEAKLPNGLILKWGIIKSVYFDERHHEYIYFDKPFDNDCMAAFFSVGQHDYAGGLRTVYLISKDRSKIVCLPGCTGQILTCDMYWFALGN